MNKISSSIPERKKKKLYIYMCQLYKKHVEFIFNIIIYCLLWHLLMKYT